MPTIYVMGRRWSKFHGFEGWESETYRWAHHAGIQKPK